MAKSITIRDVPDDTRNELAARAARSGRSLQEYLRTMLVDHASRPAVEDLIARVRARKLATRSKLVPEKILKYRDVDRR